VITPLRFSRLTRDSLRVPDFDPGKNLLFLLMPRGTFKSSVVTIGFTLQFILNEPNAPYPDRL
jgi:hypothetical protein